MLQFDEDLRLQVLEATWSLWCLWHVTKNVVAMTSIF